MSFLHMYSYMHTSPVLSNMESPLSHLEQRAWSCGGPKPHLPLFALGGRSYHYTQCCYFQPPKT